MQFKIVSISTVFQAIAFQKKTKKQQEAVINSVKVQIAAYSRVFIEFISKK
ncbi:hypothetical protein CKA32_000997 [Geitlerinema sp. FC II]|nr:hypothetical protein CKA32_000997 [Geitlerinema sp. FC II]